LIDPELLADVGSNPTGLYELTGVLTHAGSNADSGHWQGWTKQKEGGKSLSDLANSDDWWRFDDNKVTSVPESKILSLDGGGEADTAYSMSSHDISNNSLAVSCKGVSQKVVGA
jgi:ubiquitin carboxyl-terminal hydrolase 14